ncbi:MAG: hypothetical protein RLW62_06195 [Gammaproteobacteria bacterium]
MRAAPPGEEQRRGACAPCVRDAGTAWGAALWIERFIIIGVSMTVRTGALTAARASGYRVAACGGCSVRRRHRVDPYASRHNARGKRDADMSRAVGGQRAHAAPAAALRLFSEP